MSFFSLSRPSLRAFVLRVLGQLALLYVLMQLHGWIVGRGMLLAPFYAYGSEIARMTVGRLSCLLLAPALAAVLLWRSRGETRDFWFGLTAGHLLWQALGEDLWQLSFAGSSLLRLEDPAALPAILAWTLLYAVSARLLPFRLRCAALSFALDWWGHFLLFFAYMPAVPGVPPELRLRCAGILCGAGLLAWSFLRLKKADSSAAERLASPLAYLGLALFFFAWKGM